MLPATVSGPTGSCAVPATVPPSSTFNFSTPPLGARRSPATSPATVRSRSPDSLRMASVLPPTSTPVSAPVRVTVTAPPEL